MQHTVAVLGDGAWGTALAVHLANTGRAGVRLWSAFAETHEKIHRDRESPLLPGVAIPESVRLTASESAAVESAGLWVVAVPTVYLRETAGRFAGLRRGAGVVSVAKGMEADTARRPTEVIASELGPGPTAVLSGPSHAEEVARGMPTSLAAASPDAGLAARVQRLFHTDRFRVYTNGDLVGVELAGALKNVIGVAAGVSDGLGFGDNAKSALLTRGLVEACRLGEALGARPATFHGLAGLGDLITTCFSPHGRNRRLGEAIGRGLPLEEATRGWRMVAEGVRTCEAACRLAAERGVEVPIMAAVRDVLFGGKSPTAAFEELMRRGHREEGGLVG